MAKINLLLPDAVASLVQNQQPVELKPLRGEWNIEKNSALMEQLSLVPLVF
jgi:hypothetical protein